MAEISPYKQDIHRVIYTQVKQKPREMRQRKILENLPKYKKMYLKKYRLGIDNKQNDHI